MNALPAKRAIADVAFVVPRLTLSEVKARPGRHIFVPVPEARFAPVLRCGDFAIIDQWRQDTTPGSLVYLKFNGGSANFALIRGRAAAPFVGTRVSFGVQAVHHMSGKVEHWPCGDIFTEEHLKEVLVGHVVGILGNGDGAFNWGAL